MPTKPKIKHVYLIKGWTNLDCDIKKIVQSWGNRPIGYAVVKSENAACALIESEDGRCALEWRDFYELHSYPPEPRFNTKEFNEKFYDYLRKPNTLSKKQREGLIKEKKITRGRFERFKAIVEPCMVRNGKIIPKPTYKIVVAEQQLKKSSAHFKNILLYHLALIQLTEKNRDIILNSALLQDPHGHKLNNVNVIPGEVEGIDGFVLNTNRNKTNYHTKKYLLEQEEVLSWPIKNVMEGRIAGCGQYLNWIRSLGKANPLAGVPGHCRILSGEKALETLEKTGYEPIITFFKKVVEEYEGREI